MSSKEGFTPTPVPESAPVKKPDSYPDFTSTYEYVPTGGSTETHLNKLQTSEAPTTAEKPEDKVVLGGDLKETTNPDNSEPQDASRREDLEKFLEDNDQQIQKEEEALRIEQNEAKLREDEENIESVFGDENGEFLVAGVLPEQLRVKKPDFKTRRITQNTKIPGEPEREIIKYKTVKKVSPENSPLADDEEVDEDGNVVKVVNPSASETESPAETELAESFARARKIIDDDLAQIEKLKPWGSLPEAVDPVAETPAVETPPAPTPDARRVPTPSPEAAPTVPTPPRAASVRRAVSAPTTTEAAPPTPRRPRRRTLIGDIEEANDNLEELIDKREMGSARNWFYSAINKIKIKTGWTRDVVAGFAKLKTKDKFELAYGDFGNDIMIRKKTRDLSKTNRNIDRSDRLRERDDADRARKIEEINKAIQQAESDGDVALVASLTEARNKNIPKISRDPELLEAERGNLESQLDYYKQRKERILNTFIGNIDSQIEKVRTNTSYQENLERRSKINSGINTLQSVISRADSQIISLKISLNVPGLDRLDRGIIEDSIKEIKEASKESRSKLKYYERMNSRLNNFIERTDKRTKRFEDYKRTYVNKRDSIVRKRLGIEEPATEAAEPPVVETTEAATEVVTTPAVEEETPSEGEVSSEKKAEKAQDKKDIMIRANNISLTNERDIGVESVQSGLKDYVDELIKIFDKINKEDSGYDDEAKKLAKGWSSKLNKNKKLVKATADKKIDVEILKSIKEVCVNVKENKDKIK
jgi:hypothetical protein